MVELEPGPRSDRCLVEYDVRDGIATLRFNDPERRNGWSSELESEYFAALTRAGDDPGARVVVVTGSGPTFCPGMHRTGLESAVEAEAVPTAGRLPQSFPWSIPKPMIAAINGACAGVGLTQALYCDLRFAARGAKITTAFAHRGLAAEYGMSWLLPRLVGTERAMDLLLSGRVIDADEAQRLGLVSSVVEPEDLLPTVFDYAKEMVRNCSPLSMATIRRQVLSDLSLSYRQSYERSKVLMQGLVQRPDFAEGVASFVECRPPAFPPLTSRPWWPFEDDDGGS